MNEHGRENCCVVYLTLLPYIDTAGELKTKPTQQAVRRLMEAGISADILLCRSKIPLGSDERRKLGLFCNVDKDDVIAALDVDNIYRIPLSYHEQGLDVQVLKHFGLLDKAPEPDLRKWQDIIDTMAHFEHHVKIAVVGKYCGLPDAYKSLREALVHAGIANKTKVNIEWVDSESLENMDKDAVVEKLCGFHGILVPGGFGSRGVEGKIKAITYARENKVPFFGICLGMQMAVVEACRNLVGIANANSTEFGNDCTPVITRMKVWEKDGQKTIRPDDGDLGGTMRLGAYPCVLKANTLASRIYDNADLIHERHRHRYEMDISYEKALAEKGVVISGRSPDGFLPEIIEIPDHPFFFAGQFHPEFKSKPFAAHPVFKAFISAALKQSDLL